MNEWANSQNKAEVKKVLCSFQGYETAENIFFIEFL